MGELLLRWLQWHIVRIIFQDGCSMSLLELSQYFKRNLVAAYLDEEELDEEESEELLELLLLELLAEVASIISMALSAISARSCLMSLSLSNHLALNFGLPRLACSQTCNTLIVRR